MDRVICDILAAWKAESHISTKNRVIQYTYRGGVLTLYVSLPGYLIGPGGKLINKYRKLLSNSFSNFKEIKFVETEPYWV